MEDNEDNKEPKVISIADHNKDAPDLVSEMKPKGREINMKDWKKNKDREEIYKSILKRE